MQKYLKHLHICNENIIFSLKEMTIKWLMASLKFLNNL